MTPEDRVEKDANLLVNHWWTSWGINQDTRENPKKFLTHLVNEALRNESKTATAIERERCIQILEWRAADKYTVDHDTLAWLIKEIRKGEL